MYNGLTDKEVIESRKKYGSNLLKSKKKNSFFKLLIESLGDPIIKILLVALAIKVVFLFKDFDWYETLGILIAIFFRIWLRKSFYKITGRIFKNKMQSFKKWR